MGTLTARRMTSDLSLASVERRSLDPPALGIFFMMYSNSAPAGMVVTPHHLASASAQAVLREGGNAIEAMVAAASTIAVVYPHMNSLGGDGFWLIVPPQGDPIAIDASGPAGSLANRAIYDGLDRIPHRGPKAAITVAGTVGGWLEALRYAAELRGTSLPLKRLLADAIRYAEHGMPVTSSQSDALTQQGEALSAHAEFRRVFLPDGTPPLPGSRFTQPDLARTLTQLAQDGLDSFYRGPWPIPWRRP